MKWIYFNRAEHSLFDFVRAVMSEFVGVVANQDGYFLKFLKMKTLAEISQYLHLKTKANTKLLLKALS